jgi:predicted nucleotidyltransferase
VKSVTATLAKNQFGQLLEACMQAPVAIERHGRVVAYVVAPRDFAPAAAAAGPAMPGIGPQLADRLQALGGRYATVFGSVGAGRARADSDIDIGVSFGKPMSSRQREAAIAAVAEVSGRSVDLIDLESASGLILSRALGGREILCDAPGTRQRMIARLLRTEDDRRVAAQAARVARAGLFS